MRGFECMSPDDSIASWTSLSGPVCDHILAIDLEVPDGGVVLGAVVVVVGAWVSDDPKSPQVSPISPKHFVILVISPV